MATDRNPAAVLSLVFTSHTVDRPMSVLRQDPPWRVVRSFLSPSGEQLVHLHNLSGGILGGDQLELNLALHGTTCVLATSTGATRIYKHRTGLPRACSRTRASVSRGALLEFLPDQVIPFRDAYFEQHTAIELEPEGAGLFWWETIASGRSAAQEDLAYASLRFSALISCAGKPIAIERFTLEPAKRQLRQQSVLGPFRCYSTFYICNTGVARQQWNQLLEMLEEEAYQHSSDRTLWGVTRLVQHGIVLRGLGQEASELQDCLYRFWKLAKPFLYGRQAVIPRKVH